MKRGITLASMVLLGVSLLAPADLVAQSRDETVIYGLQSDVQNWDPPNSVLRESIILGYNVFDHLAARDLKTGKVGPSLAVSWKNLDYTTWEVKLRQGVKFHDGSPFSARDVKASFDRVLNPENKLTARGNHAKIKSVEVVDDLTARFKTDGPYPLFVERLTAQVMQSEKVIREKGHEWMQENPVGTGPYKLVRWNKKQEHVLIRNEDYWDPSPLTSTYVSASSQSRRRRSPSSSPAAWTSSRRCRPTRWTSSTSPARRVRRFRRFSGLR